MNSSNKYFAPFFKNWLQHSSIQQKLKEHQIAIQNEEDISYIFVFGSRLYEMEEFYNNYCTRDVDLLIVIKDACLQNKISLEEISVPIFHECIPAFHSITPQWNGNDFFLCNSILDHEIDVTMYTETQMNHLIFSQGEVSFMEAISLLHFFPHKEYKISNKIPKDVIAKNTIRFEYCVWKWKSESDVLNLLEKWNKESTNLYEKWRQSFSKVSSNSDVKSKKKFLKEKQDLIALKSLYHSARLLDFACQLASYHCIVDFTSCLELLSYLKTEYAQLLQQDQNEKSREEFFKRIYSYSKEIIKEKHSQLKQLIPKEWNK